MLKLNYGMRIHFWRSQTCSNNKDINEVVDIFWVDMQSYTNYGLYLCKKTELDIWMNCNFLSIKMGQWEYMTMDNDLPISGY